MSKYARERRLQSINRGITPSQNVLPLRRPQTDFEKKSVYGYINSMLEMYTLTEACQKNHINIATYKNWRKKFEPKRKTVNPWPKTIRYKLEPTAVIRVGSDTVIEVPKYKETGTLIKWRERLKNWNHAEETRNARNLT